ncbi:MAG: TolC family protein [Flavobacteriales bacterium]
MNPRLLLLMLLLLPSLARAGDSTRTFTLKQAVEYAAQHNYAAQLALKNYEISRKQYMQYVSAGLPQVNGTLNYNWNIEPQVFLLPDFTNPSSGNFIQLQATPPTTVTTNLTASMIVVDGSYIYGVQAAKTYKELSLNQQESELQKIKQNVTRAYYNVLFIDKNMEVLTKTVENLDKLAFETEAYFKEGFREGLDVEQVVLNRDITVNTLNKLKTQRESALNMLKMSMGFPVDSLLNTSDSFESLDAEKPVDYMLDASTIFDPASNIDIKVLDRLYRVNRQNYQVEFSKAFPSLSAFFQWSYGGFNDNKKRAVLFSPGNTYYRGGTLLGATLNVPIFSSWGRVSSQQKIKLEAEKVKIQKTEAEENMKMAFKNIKAEYVNNLSTLANDKRNIDLAKKIQETNRTKFREGLIGSFELINSENQYLNALNAYYSTLFNLLQNRLDYDKLTNKL